MADTKPPLGIQPRKYWLHERAKELSRAIYEQFAQGYGGRIDLELISKWHWELAALMVELRSL